MNLNSPVIDSLDTSKVSISDKSSVGRKKRELTQKLSSSFDADDIFSTKIAFSKKAQQTGKNENSIENKPTKLSSQKVEETSQAEDQTLNEKKSRKSRRTEKSTKAPFMDIIENDEGDSVKNLRENKELQPQVALKKESEVRSEQNPLKSSSISQSCQNSGHDDLKNSQKHAQNDQNKDTQDQSSVLKETKNTKHLSYLDVSDDEEEKKEFLPKNAVLHKDTKNVSGPDDVQTKDAPQELANGIGAGKRRSSDSSQSQSSHNSEEDSKEGLEPNAYHYQNDQKNQTNATSGIPLSNNTKNIPNYAAMVDVSSSEEEENIPIATKTGNDIPSTQKATGSASNSNDAFKNDEVESKNNPTPKPKMPSYAQDLEDSSDEEESKEVLPQRRPLQKNTTAPTTGKNNPPTQSITKTQPPKAADSIKKSTNHAQMPQEIPKTNQKPKLPSYFGSLDDDENRITSSKNTQPGEPSNILTDLSVDKSRRDEPTTKKTVEHSTILEKSAFSNGNQSYSVNGYRCARSLFFAEGEIDTEPGEARTFFQKDLSDNNFHTNFDNLSDSEPDPEAKRIIKWKVRNIKPTLRAFDLYNGLIGKGFHVIRVRINKTSEHKKQGIKADDPLFDMLFGSNRALKIEEKIHNIRDVPFLNELFSNPPIRTIPHNSNQTKNLQGALRTCLERCSNDPDNEERKFYNELEGLINKVQFWHNLKERLRYLNKFIKNADGSDSDDDDSGSDDESDEDDAHGDDEERKIDRKLLASYRKEALALNAELEKEKAAIQEMNNEIAKKPKKDEKVDKGEIYIWGTLLENINKVNEKITFQGPNKESLHIFIDNDRPNANEIENLTPSLKSKIEKTNINYHKCKFGTFIVDAKTGEKNVFRSYFDVDYAMSPQPGRKINANQGKLFAFYSEDKQRSKKMEVIFDVHSDNLQFKFEFSYKHCDSVYIEDVDYEVRIYFSLMAPPKFYAYMYNTNEYLDYLLNDKWERVDYFITRKILDAKSKADQIDELERIYLTRSTVVMLSFDKKNPSTVKELKKLKEHFNKINIHLEETVGRKFRHKNFYSISPALKYDAITAYTEEELPFEIKYTILALISEKKFDLFQIKKTFLPKIMNLSGPQDYKITEKTLKDLANPGGKTPKDPANPGGKTLKDPANQGGLELAIRKCAKESDSLDFEKIFMTKWEENKAYSELLSLSNGLEHMSYTKRVTITPSSVLFRCEEPELSNAVLRRFKDQNPNFLRVNFCDEMQEGTKKMKYVAIKRFNEVLKGLKVFNKTFNMLAFSASQLRTDSLWMFADNEKLTGKMIRESLGNFSNIKIPAKYAARVGQSFSSSYQVLDIKKQNIAIKMIDDIKAESGALFSDGIGVISNDLMDMVRLKMEKSVNFAAIQIRMGGVKGVLAKAGNNPKYQEKNTIWIRPSMKKFEADIEHVELLDYSKHRYGYLNRQVLILLMTLGINDDDIIAMQEGYIEKLQQLTYRDASLFSYISNEEQSPVNELLRDCFNAGVSMKDEPFINGVIQTIKARGFLNLKAKSNILVTQSARLLGVLDESEILESGEVYIKFLSEVDHYAESAEDKQFTQKEGKGAPLTLKDGTRVMITRNPCLHPGDIRVLTARSGKEYEERLGHLVNCVVFPQKGKRPHTAEISGSDLDGDMFFVTWDKRLIPENVDEPMQYDTEKKQLDNKGEVTMDQVREFYIEHMNSATLGQIDNSHLALADASRDKARDKDCLALAQAHSIAVDFVKTGIKPSIKDLRLATVWPDFMGKSDNHQSAISQTLLGHLYRHTIHHMKQCGISKSAKGKEVSSISLVIDEDMAYGNWHQHIPMAIETLLQYHKDMYSLLALYGLQSEFEVYSGNFLVFHTSEGKKQNLERLQKKILDHMLVLKYKYTVMFGGEHIAQSKDEEALSKASALYLVSYYHKSALSPDREGNVNKLAAKINECMDKLEKHGPERALNAMKELNTFFNDPKKTRYIGLPWFIAREQLLAIKRQKAKGKGERFEKQSLKEDNPSIRITRGP